jgi:hypothetical protein
VLAVRLLVSLWSRWSLLVSLWSRWKVNCPCVESVATSGFIEAITQNVTASPRFRKMVSLWSLWSRRGAGGLPLCGVGYHMWIHWVAVRRFGREALWQRGRR